MKRHFYVLILCALILTNGMAQQLTVKGKIKDADTAMVLLGAAGKFDTAFTVNGEFLFHKKLLHPAFITIAFVKNRQSIDAIKEGNERKIRSKEDIASRDFFVAGGDVVINTAFAELARTVVLMPQHVLQDKYDVFLKRFNPLVKIARAMIDSSYAKKSEAEKQLCREFIDRINQIEMEVAERFVTENTDNAVGAYVLYRYCRIDNYQRLDSLYQLFNPVLRSTTFLKNIKEKITALSGIAIGKSVPFFAMNTAENKLVRIDDYKGKYLVLDFWGSWCMPCVSGFPKMKEYYTKYQEQLAIIGIACNDTDTAWKNAIAKYELQWIQVLNGKGGNDLAGKFNIEAYPTKLLIDKEGKLVEVFKGEGIDFYNKLDILIGK